jgi:tetratricopeptide (TPR) repeat protein
MSAESPEAFLRSRRGRTGWKMFAALKTEVDRLVHSDLKAARNLVECIDRVAALTEEPTSVSFAQASHASLLHVLGNHSEANRLYESSARAMQSEGHRTQAAILQKQQVYVLAHMGRYAEALRVARSARRVFTNGDQTQLAQLETNVGNVYYLLDRYPKALRHYDRAREILSTEGGREMLAFVDFSRANIFTETDRPDEALTLLEGAAIAWDRAGRKLLNAQARFHIAYLQFLRGNYNTALAGYYQARDRLNELGSTQLVAWCNLEIAEILLSLNSFDEAAENAASARSQFRELGMPYESARSAVVHALAGMGMGELVDAQRALAAARDLFARDRNTTFTAFVDSYLADLALRRGEWAEAARCAELSLRVFSRQKLATRSAYSRLLAARAAYQAGNQTRALRLAKSALAAVKSHFAASVVYQCHHLIARVHRGRGKKHAALDSFRKAVETVEEMRGGIAADEFKASFVRDKMEVYEDAIAACLDEGGEGRVEEAFRLVESSKSRALADLLARYLRSAPARKTRAGAKDLEEQTRARLLKLIEDLNWYSSQAGIEEDKGGQRRAGVADRYRMKVARCERQIGQLFRRLEATGSAFAEIQRMQGAAARDLCKVLEPGETAIEYFTTGDEISAFVATPDRIRVERGIASKSDVERLLGALRFQLEKFNYGPGFADEHFEQLNRATNQYLIQLNQMSFAPLEEYIEGDKLIVMPHGALHYVPFQALLDRRGYLIDRFEISYAPSATVLKLCRLRAREMRKTRSGARTNGASHLRLLSSNGRSDDIRMVALGAGDSETPSISVEVNALRRIFPNAVTLMGEEATRGNFLKFAPGARFLHLASHGHFRRDNPMFSFLQLADSALNFYSLLDLKLDAEMVTLSACHTGVNMVFPGDELHGLMRGFLYAGTPSLVASLWAANDASTADFMSTMYSRIREGDTKRAALRAAQLAVKDAYGHPYYWAPFVLMGSPN